MTRDELIEQAARIASGRRSGKRGLVHWQRIVARLVDADWRPVYDDDATVEKVARTIREEDTDITHDVVWLDDREERYYTRLSRAALAALRGSDV